MRLSIEAKWMTGAFSLAVLLTGFSSFVSYQNTTQLMESTSRVERTHTILTNLTNIVTTLVDADSERRNYLLSGRKEDLAGYNAAVQTLGDRIHQLRLERIEEPVQQQRLATLESLATQWQSSLERSRTSQDDQTSLAISNTLWSQSQQFRSKIQRIIDDMQASENDRLQQWVEQVQRNTRYRILTEFSSTVLSFSILLGTFWSLYQQMVKRQQAERKHQQAEAQQRALAQEKELSELKLRFFSMVSHEFRTPLSLILGSAQLLTDDTQDWSLEKKRNNLERIQSAARVMNQLLTDTLTITRAEAGKLEFSPNVIDVESFCLNLIEDLKILSETHQFEFISPKYCPPCRLDEKLLYSILSNLLSNAIKYSPAGSTIQFRLNVTPKEIIFQIQDQGIGIPAEAQQNLYEPFHRANNVGMTPGTGLGLAVVKKCVDLHQGQVFVESDVRIGTTVTVRLPSISSSSTALENNNYPVSYQP
jgi:signal transduction histidine kinase